MPPLITVRWRHRALALITVGVLLVAVLGAIVWHATTTAFDNWAWRELVPNISNPTRYTLLRFSDPIFSTSMIAVVVLAALAARRWTLAVLAAGAPLLALFVTEIVLKPLIARVLGPFVVQGSTLAGVSGSFPSGHETAVASAVLVMAVAAGQLRPGRAVTGLIGVVLVAWTLAAGVGLVRGFYHYATDVIGAWGVSVAVVLGSALLLDRVAAASTGRRAAARADAAVPVGNRTQLTWRS